MVFMSNDAFLTGLTKLFQSAKTSGTVWLTMKKYDGRTKPRPRKNKKEGVSSNKGSAFVEHEENYCLLRATNGKKKISTMVSSKEVTRFQMAYGNLLKAHMDGLKKRSTLKPKQSKKKQK